MRNMVFLFRKLAGWLKDLWIWFISGINVIAFIGIVLGSMYLFGICYNKPYIIFAGLTQQLIAIIITIKSLLKIKDHFKHPSLFQEFFNYWKRFPSWNKHTNVHISMGALQGQLGKINLSGYTRISENQSIEVKVRQIIHNLDFINTNLGQHSTSIDQLKTQLNNFEDQVTQDQMKVEKTIRGDMETLHTSDWLKAFLGLNLLLVGTIVSTLPSIYPYCNW